MKVTTTNLVSFLSTDGLQLPGMLFEPSKKTKKVAINLHGNGSASVFYSYDRAVAFGKALNQNGISFFTFNNRGAHYVKRLNRHVDGEMQETKEGTYFEIIKDCVHDIDGAITGLKELGYEDFYLIGHSSGANKICVYNHYKPDNEVAKYILVAGGDDTGLWHEMVGGTENFQDYLVLAKAQIEAGNGRDLIPPEISDYSLSYQSFYDTCNPDGDYNVFPFNEALNSLKLSHTQPLFQYFKELDKPTLVVYGEDDEFCYGDVSKVVSILEQECSHPALTTFQIIPGADHGFSEQELELAESICSWLAK